MTNPILNISDRGQITIPKKLRTAYKTTYFKAEKNDEGILLKPMIVEEYDEELVVTPKLRKELDEAWGDYQKNGGTTLKEMKDKHNL